MLQKKKELCDFFYTCVRRTLYVTIFLMALVLLIKCYRDGFSYRHYLDKVQVVNIPSQLQQCMPPPPRDDDRKCGSRTADRKCCQYMWEMNYKREILAYEKCSTNNYGIVGGNDALPGEFPHMVALGWSLKATDRKYKFMCGGSLISENFVLTAGHCTKVPLKKHKDVLNAKPKIVRMGGANISDEPTYDELNRFHHSSNIINIAIKNITIHPYYKSPAPDYDVALIELIKKVKFTLTQHPACVSSSWMRTPYKTVLATGWGVTENHSKNMSEILQVASLDIIEYDDCFNLSKKLTNRHFQSLERHQICAGVMQGGVDTCQGDSGGPIQIKLNTSFGSMHRIIGVTSFGGRCGSSQLPSIYTSVEAVVSWIEATVWPEEYYGQRINTKEKRSWLGSRWNNLRTK